ncbi:NUDIX hydrolase [Dermatophilus congolensis]|uniref:Dihydroneopterin triphosphate pyrophosphatase n=1 Tax=Dermatophilus congolensis TaxID=1863 RepID=A0A239VBB5_9MICO|nr:NUDIX domain-containing protein [Dermatophilus congolensis]MBO3128472.1 NUDIX domain-containing protein [Dermatophilus congolensis]MBO3132890.1 NUDIX domain-containing protein [Dermatophilus congolensis]MBO3132951.1 NUDIX domain-containing protein [Dermatophilus congolensis]MBO3135188.1 NUDIX domain-containing protein [Dermatophilus congolensis]MBO3137424.1 NUDIX domain-containing protein [Dermatophilus congolensis]
MPIPEHVARLRAKVGHDLLWLPGVTAVVVREGDRGVEVVLVRRSDNGEYTPVTGVVDPLESPAVTAVREAKEEACIDVEVERLIAVRVTPVVTYPNGDQSAYVDVAFRCRWVGGVLRVGDDESSEVGWWPVADLPPMEDRHREAIEIACRDDGEVVYD